MQRKIPARSILFLPLIQIGLLLLAWWGGFYQFLLPAAVLGQADWGTGAWLAAELLLILFVMNRFFERAGLPGAGRFPDALPTGQNLAVCDDFVYHRFPGSDCRLIQRAWGGAPPGRGTAAVYPGGWSAAGAVLDRGDLGWLALGRTAPGSGGDRRCGRIAQPCRPAHAVCPLRSGTVCPADGGLAPALCGSVAGASLVLLIKPHTK